MIAKNPKLLLNVEEADLEADPLYGEVRLDWSTVHALSVGVTAGRQSN